MLGAVLARGPAVCAQSAGEIALSREEFRRGVTAARAARWAQARVAFEHAYVLYPDPLTLLNLAGAQAHAGAPLAGAESYRRFLRAPDAPLAYRAVAEQALREVEARVPHVRLAVTGLRPGDALALDAEVLSPAAIDVSLPVEPGAHRVRVLRAGREIARVAFETRESQTDAVQLRVPAPSAAVAPRAAHVARSVRPRVAQGGPWTSPWLWLGVGALFAGGAVAAVVLAGERAPAPVVGTLPPGHLVIE